MCIALAIDPVTIQVSLDVHLLEACSYVAMVIANSEENAQRSQSLQLYIVP